jgi:AraC-like DNA-binding protein
MLSELFKSRARIQILRDGPRGLLLEGFAQCLSEAGYATITVRKHLRAAEHFIHFINWNDRHSPPERNLNKQSLVRFERHLSRCQCQQYSHARPQKVVHGVHLFLSHLRDTGIINLPWAPNHDPALLSAFCQWMHQQRGISDVTLSTYRRSRPAPPWLQRAREQLREEYRSSLTLASVAKGAGVSREHLARAFRFHFGMSPSGFVQSVRLHDACQQITETEIPLVEVAAQCGYADQSHMCRWVSRKKGVSPISLRKAGHITYVQDLACASQG